MRIRCVPSVHQEHTTTDQGAPVVHVQSVGEDSLSGNIALHLETPAAEIVPKRRLLRGKIPTFAGRVNTAELTKLGNIFAQKKMTPYVENANTVSSYKLIMCDSVVKQSCLTGHHSVVT